MIRLLLALCGALVVFAVACGGSDSKPGAGAPAGTVTPSPGAQGCSPARAYTAGDSDQALTSGGIARTYVLHIPTGYDGATRVPVVLAFHGFGLSAKQMMEYTRLGALADQRRFVAVALDGAGSPPHWNWRKAVNEPNDLQFVADVFKKLDADLCIDPDMTFAAGFSDGAAMSRIAACEAPGRIAAVGAVASPNVPCTADVPMIAFHGMADPVVPFEGGAVRAEFGGGTFPPVRRSVSDWARALACDGLPIISRPAASTELSTFLRCRRGDGDVLLYTFLGGGHTWPGSAPLPADVFGATSEDIDATALMWEFFAAHPLAH